MADYNPDDWTTWPQVTYTCTVDRCENKGIGIVLSVPTVDTPAICGGGLWEDGNRVLAEDGSPVDCHTIMEGVPVKQARRKRAA